MKLQAIVFDFDGIIVDTEKLHWRGFQQILEPLGLDIPWEHYLEVYVGFDDRDAYRCAFKEGGRSLSDEQLRELIDEKAEAFADLVRDTEIEAYPGVVELIREIDGVLPLGLCTGALASDVAPILKRLGITDCFDVLVSADMVSHSKPDPECYQMTIQKLQAIYPDAGIQPGNGLAFEDTLTGIRSAMGAGITTWGVAHTLPLESLGEADHAVGSFKGISLESLENTFS
jgi:beta-phosphoglucomutase